MPEPAHTATKVLQELRAVADPRVRAQMAHFGVRVEDAHGVPMVRLHALAHRIGKNHKLAQELWASGNHEARILAGLVDDPAEVTAAQMERWAGDFNAWDIVDGSCCHLFVHAGPAWKKAVAWSRRKEEFVKRAGFALMAYLAYKDKSSADARYQKLLKIIRRESCDDRHFVKKGVNWALRNIGKRNLALHRAAVRTAREIRALESAAARWIATDALRELKSAAVQRRPRKRKSRQK